MPLFSKSKDLLFLVIVKQEQIEVKKCQMKTAKIQCAKIIFQLITK